MDSYGALEAARDSAYWAAAAALAAWLIGLITLLVNGGGILLLWRQLKISEEAALAARDAVRIAASETRPWLTLSLDDTRGGVRASSPTLRAYGKVAVSNVGKTPALAVGVKYRVLIEPTNAEIAESFAALRLDMEGRTKVIFPDQTVRLSYWSGCEIPSDDLGTRRQCKLAALVTYSSGAMEHETPVLFEVWPAEDQEGDIFGWNLSEEGTFELRHTIVYDLLLEPT